MVSSCDGKRAVTIASENDGISVGGIIYVARHDAENDSTTEFEESPIRLLICTLDVGETSAYMGETDL